MSVIAKYLISLLLLFYTTAMAWGQVDSVMKSIHSLPCDTVRLVELWKWSKKAMDSPDELIYLDTLLNEATRQGNIDYQSFVYRNKVRHYFNLNEFEGARQATEAAVRFLREHKKYSLLFDVRSMLINMYTDREEYEISLWKGHEMYKEAEALDDDRGKVSACYVLAYACYFSQRNREAIDWCRRGLDLALKYPDESTEGIEFLFMTAESYYNLKMMDSVKLYVDSAYRKLSVYAESRSRSIPEYYSFYQLWKFCRYATGYLCHHDLENARASLEEAAALMKGYKYDVYRDLYYYTWSDYYLAAGKYEEAMDALEKGREYEFEWSPAESSEYPKKRAMIYYARGDYRTATDEILRSAFLADSMNNVRFIQQSKQLRSVYDMNRLEAESERRIFIIHIQIVLVLALCAVVFLLFYYLFRFYRMKQELAVAVKKACEADRKTSGFLHNMGHEVQVFLQDISGLSDALIEESENSKKQEYATEICSRNERAQRVIFDILDVSKIESDRMQFQYERISLNGLVEEVCSSLLPNVPDKVKIRLLPCEDRLFTTDPVRLNRVLYKLLHYAGTHACGGCIRIKYESRENEVCFTISGDNWIMEQEEYQYLFDRLVQTSGRLEDMQLEMLISQGLIVRMGGTLTVFPDRSGGTRFEFVLPDQPLN